MCGLVSGVSDFWVVMIGGWGGCWQLLGGGCVVAGGVLNLGLRCLLVGLVFEFGFLEGLFACFCWLIVVL